MTPLKWLAVKVWQVIAAKYVCYAACKENRFVKMHWQWHFVNAEGGLWVRRVGLTAQTESQFSCHSSEFHHLQIKHFRLFIWLQCVESISFCYVIKTISLYLGSILFLYIKRVFFLLRTCHSGVNELITGGIIIRCHVQVEVVLQLPLQSLKRGPVLFVLLPAIQHDFIHNFGAAGGARHPVAHGNPLDHLVVSHGWNNQSDMVTDLTGEIYVLTFRWLHQLHNICKIYYNSW